MQPVPSVRFDLGGHEEHWWCPFCGAANWFGAWEDGQRAFWCDSCQLVGVLAAVPPAVATEPIRTEHVACAEFTVRWNGDGNVIDNGPFVFSMGPVHSIEGPAVTFCLETRDGTQMLWSAW